MLPQRPQETYSPARAPPAQEDIFTSLPPRRPWGSLDNSVNRLGLAPDYRSADSPFPPPGASTRPRSQSLATPIQRPPMARSRSTTLEEGGLSPTTAPARKSPMYNTFTKFVGRMSALSRPQAFDEKVADRDDPDYDDVSETAPSSGMRSRANSDSVIDAQRPPFARRDTGVSEGSVWSSDDDEEDWDKNDLDPDDPRLKQKVVYDKKGNRIITNTEHVRTRVSSQRQSLRCITLFARALLQFGAPTHRSESLLTSLSRELSVNAHFVQFPGIIVASFSPPRSAGKSAARTGVGNTTRFIKANGGLDLGRLHDTHCLYRDLMHDRISAQEGAQKLEKLMNAKTIYGAKARAFFAFGCALAICPLAFGGSFADMWIAGALSCVMMVINNKYATENPIMANIFELVMAVVVSLIARALSFVNNGELFCYQAITSGGVVLILPGFLILLSSLDLANKHMLTGSIKLVYTITYTLFLAFCLTLGSDIFFILDSSARHAQDQATAQLGSTTTLNGTFFASSPVPASNITAAPYNNWTGSFNFQNSTAVDAYNNNLINGCFRDPSWGWYAQPLPSWTLFLLVPAFSILISLNNMQPWFSFHFLAMVVISVFSFLANKFANKYAFSHSSIITTVGAFVVGICGNIYSRLFRGSGFTVSVTGVLFLVPSGLSDAGGLADTYRGTNTDYFSASLLVAERMIQVGIGITIGLLFSGMFVYLFGKKKRTAVFAF